MGLIFKQSLKVCIICFLSFHLHGQKKKEDNKISYVYDALWALKVKQVDEFIDRFNNKIKFLDKGVFKNIQSPISQREIIIKSLFNAEKEWDEDLQKRFLKSVNGDNKSSYLNFYDQSWFAYVKCTVLFKEKEYPMSLTLQIQINPNLTTKWVIIAVKAPFLRLPQPPNPNAHINPTNHNLRFSELPEVMHDSLNLRNYVNSEFREDRLTLLFYEIMNGNITMKRVNELTFHFLQLDNWLMVVRKFNRNTVNSGWLIDELYEMSWEEKGQYAVEKLNLY